MRAVLQYFVHYGQYIPAVRAQLQSVPHDGDFAKTRSDPAFVAFIRMHGDLFTE